MLHSFESVNPQEKQHAWRAQMLRKLPARWSRVIGRRVERMDIKHRDWKTGNTYLRESVAAYADCVFPLDASLSDIREAALRRALDAADLAERLGSMAAILPALAQLCTRWGVALPAAKTPGGIVARCIDPSWWGRRLRATHGRKTEAMAIRLGLVSGKADKYLSEENRRRGSAQQTRNGEAMARTLAINEDGEIFTLAQLIEKSVSNPVLRRGELMLRMRGMEEVGREYGCAVEFAVVTPSSRFHAVRANGSTNDRYDGSTPREAHAYLQKQWEKCRAWLHRRNVAFYGMRTVEAHQDGTPHWNLMVFLRNPEHVGLWREAIETYFLLPDNPLEPGALEHRCRFEEITDAKGGATGYIAKYISKNVDGYGLKEDLAGDPIIESAQRVGLWAKLHGIRQFQPIAGGAPVTVWRELRRIAGDAMADAPEPMRRAWIAAQRVPGADGQEDKRADYAEFMRACGGPWIKRKERALWLHMVEQDGIGRYGEPLGLKAAGVVARGIVRDDQGGIVGVVEREVVRAVLSVRRTWTIVKNQDARFMGLGAGTAPSRTRVNNCTQTQTAHRAPVEPAADFEAARAPHTAERGQTWIQ
ncbi:replication endonuclease [Paraburkholderia mimosarum]|uniref:replication endonuclease n=1 Tax=Paraburkholderia mimosarum TaxID=312026 RepID=UPI0003FC4C4D|nr:replication endonuclease [Paraburkholderia mimosarum]